MKILLCALLLAFTANISLADTACRKSADGEVDCQQVHEDAALDSETTDQPVSNAEPRDDSSEAPESSDSTSDADDGGEVGDKTNQDRAPGVTY